MPLETATLSALIGAGANLVTGGTNMALQGKSNAKTREFNQRMMERQNEINMRNWEIQNEYNHPMKQVERMREAGLNPMWQFGKGGQGASSAPPSPSAASYQDRAPTAPQLGTDYITMRAALEQMGFVKKQSDKVQAETDAINLSNSFLEEKLGLENKTKRMALKTQAFRNKVEMQRVNMEIAKIQNEVRALDLRYAELQEKIRNNKATEANVREANEIQSKKMTAEQLIVKYIEEFLQNLNEGDAKDAPIKAQQTYEWLKKPGAKKLLSQPGLFSPTTKF